jgi:NAD(P)H-hydrate epimerase
LLSTVVCSPVTARATNAQRLLTADEMRRADALTIAAGTDGFTLMRRAGRAVAEAAAGMLPAGAPALILCGPGNNGGDGFVAAALLAERGFAVTVALLGARAALRGDAAKAGRMWAGPVLPGDQAEPERAGVVVDALFGSGLSRDLDGGAAALVRRVDAAGRPVLAVDIPSGIDSDTGAVRGAAIRAARTITFARRKPGHLLLPGRLHCGPVAVADIGIGDGTIEALGSRLEANHPETWIPAFPRPTLDAHKYRRGHALVLSGDALHTGAARMTVRAALRVGAGLVTLASPSDALAVNAAHLTAVMLRRCDGPQDLAAALSDPRFNAVALGPALGVGPSTRALVEAALAADRAAVLDADALTSFAGSAGAFRSERTRPLVLTPHEGEFGRLFAGDAAVTEPPSKVERARRAAERTWAVVVLKGPDTVIADPDGRAAINENGSSYLATAGSGDVLAGFVAGLLAQGMPGFEAACAAVWLHAEAGRRFGPGLIAEDLSEGLPAVLRELPTGE